MISKVEKVLRSDKYNLAERRLESDQRKNRKVVAMTQARIDGWHVGPPWGRLWFTGPTSTVFVRLQDFLFVSYDLSRLSFEPFAISPKGVVRHLDPMAPSRPGYICVRSRSCPVTGCVVYTMRVVHDDRPEEYWTFAIDPLEG